MRCASCGCDQASGAQFCVRCGTRTAYAEPATWAPVMGNAAFMPTPAMPFYQREVRVAQHVYPLGLAWCAFGVLGLFMRSIGFGLWTHHNHVIGFSTFFFSALALLAGMGLLTRKSWARKLAIFLGVLCLLKFPVGTALGVYTLWVMASSRARDQWRQMQAGPNLW